MELLELLKVMPMTTRSLGSTPVFSAICADFSVAIYRSNFAVARKSIVLEASVCLEAELRRDVVDETTEIRNSFFFLPVSHLWWGLDCGYGYSTCLTKNQWSERGKNVDTKVTNSERWIISHSMHQFRRCLVVS